MNRFIYRRELRTPDFQDLDIANREEVLGLKLAAAEARLNELKTLLNEAKTRRTEAYTSTSYHSDNRPRSKRTA